MGGLRYELDRGRLLGLRGRAGLSQQALADMAGISSSLLCNYESGRTYNPSASALFQVEDALGLAHGALMREVGDDVRDAG